MDDSEQIAALEAAVASLRRQVADLEVALGSARGRIDLTMFGQVRCPACGGTRILHADRVADQGEGSAQKLALVRPSIWRSRLIGELEAYVCGACGLVEWYVKEPTSLEADGEHLVLLEGRQPGDSGPYR